MNNRKTQDAWLYAVCIVAVLITLAHLGADYIDQRDRSVHLAGEIVGHNRAVQSREPIVETCMSFWFNGDTKRVAKAMQQIKTGKVAPL